MRRLPARLVDVELVDLELHRLELVHVVDVQRGFLDELHVVRDGGRSGRRGRCRAMKRACVVLATCVVALTAGCDPGFKPSFYLPGEVTYGCTGFADAVCDDVMPELAPVHPDLTPFPAIALGARFGVTNGVSLAPDRLDDSGAQTFLARREGLAPVSDGIYVSHVEVRKAASIRVTHETEALSDVFSEIFGEDDFDLRIPDRFRAVPIDGDGHMLAGDLPTVWKSSNEAIVSIESDPAANIVRFRINSAGTANLTVTMGDLTATVPFDIQ
ncbi:MAG: hypothetical protein U0414_28410 [Polyangiaceae bacterium]